MKNEKCFPRDWSSKEIIREINDLTMRIQNYNPEDSEHQTEFLIRNAAQCHFGYEELHRRKNRWIFWMALCFVLVSISFAAAIFCIQNINRKTLEANASMVSLIIDNLNDISSDIRDIRDSVSHSDDNESNGDSSETEKPENMKMSGFKM